MRIRYYDTNTGKIFGMLSKNRLFTPGKDYRLSGLWNGYKNNCYDENICLAVAFDKDIPVGVCSFEPEDENFMSFFVKSKYRGQGLAKKLAKVVVEKNNYPKIWAMNKAKIVLKQIGYKNLKNNRLIVSVK